MIYNGLLEEEKTFNVERIVLVFFLRMIRFFLTQRARKTTTTTTKTRELNKTMTRREKKARMMRVRKEKTTTITKEKKKRQQRNDELLFLRVFNIYHELRRTWRILKFHALAKVTFPPYYRTYARSFCFELANHISLFYKIPIFICSFSPRLPPLKRFA